MKSMIWRLVTQNETFGFSIGSGDWFSETFESFRRPVWAQGSKIGAAAGDVHGALTGMRVELPGELNYARLGLVGSRLEPARLYGSVRFWHSHIEGWFAYSSLPALRRWFND